MRAIITGAGGFVGGHLAQHLTACGDAVLGLSRFPGQPLAEGESLGHSARWLSWDLAQDLPLRSPHQQAASFSELEAFSPAYIYHLAALSDPRQCGDDQPTPQAVEINVNGTQRVLQLAAQLATKPRVIIVSSCHVYAKVQPWQALVDEQAPTEPASGYGRSKYAAEQLALQAAAAQEVVVARPFHHTGPGQQPRYMVPEWAQRLTHLEQLGLQDQPLEIRTADAYLDLSDVRDIVRAYRLLAQLGQVGGVYNVGSGVAVRSGEVATQLIDLSGIKRGIRQTHPAERQEPIAQTSHLRNHTGWEPRIPLTETLWATLRYWRDNPS